MWIVVTLFLAFVIGAVIATYKEAYWYKESVKWREMWSKADRRNDELIQHAMKWQKLAVFYRSVAEELGARLPNEDEVERRIH